MRRVILLIFIGMILSGCFSNQPKPEKTTEKKGLSMDLNQNHRDSGNVDAAKVEFSVIK
jgi:PBP1b-binding outer membrane lipoprotein LpoB